MPFTSVFGGNTIYPAQPTYLQLALALDTTLEWPTEQALTGNVLAAIIDVTPAGPGLSVILPDATRGSPGYVTTFFNAGADTFSVKDTGGNTITTVASGLLWTVYLQDNTTANGTWKSFEQGAGTSVATAGSLGGAGIKAITTTLNQKMDVNEQNLDYTIVDGDRAKVIVWTGGLGTFTLPNPGVVGTDWFAAVKNNGSGSVTLSPSSGTIDGSGSLALATDESTFIFTDGSNFFTVGLGQETNSVFDFISINVAGSGDYTLSGAQLNRVAYEFTGVLTGNRNIIVPSSVQQYWVDNQTTGPYTLTVKTAVGSGIEVPQTQRTILYCDGADVINAETIAVSTPVALSQGGTGLTTVSQGDLLYASALDVLSRLGKSATATRYLANTGASNGPAWDQVNMSNGVTGTLAVAQGGTGLTTLGAGVVYVDPADAIHVLAKDLNASRYLSNQGGSNNPLWTQVDLTNGVTGTLPIANGGTGQTGANAALNAFLPSQGGNAGKFLQTDGSNASWASASGTTTNITLDGTNLNLNVFEMAGSPGGSVTVNISTSGRVYSMVPTEPAIDFSGFAGGSTINWTNTAKVMAKGGKGGYGASGASWDGAHGPTAVYSGQVGEAGGDAVKGPGAGVTFNVTNAAGFIWGGGGGGGGGGATFDHDASIANGGGGGGGAGAGEPGWGGRETITVSRTVAAGGIGTRGSFATSSANGTGGSGTQSGNSSGGAGGAGGDWGTAGSAGTSVTTFAEDVPAGTAGAAGKAVNLNGGAIVWVSGSGAPNVKGAVA